MATTQQKNASNAPHKAAESTDLYQQVVDSSPLCTLVLDKELRILYANRAVLSCFGYMPHSLPRHNLSTLIAKDCQSELSQTVRTFISQKQENTLFLTNTAFDLKGARIDGSEFPVEITLTKNELSDGGSSRIFFYLRDISRQARFENYLHNVISIDPVTGLLNRRAFEQRVSQEHEREKRRKRQYAVLLMDICQVHATNERLGTKTGDRVIRIFADYCSNFFRKSDILARWGGDEFIVFLPEIDEEQAKAIAQRLMARVKNIHIRSAKGDEDIELTLNAGLCISGKTESHHSVLGKAVECLERAQKKGAGYYVTERCS